jgi:hypothetical protein
VDFGYRYHYVCMESREREKGSIFLGGANKKGCLWFFSFFNVYGFLI